jgi:hypothetical protein
MKIIAGIVLLVVVGGCSSSSRSAWSKSDTWYHPPEDREAKPHDDLPEIPCHVIPKGQQTEAESLLDTISIRELSDSQVRHFLGSLPVKPTGTSFFLVRSVALWEGTGKFTIQHDKDNLWVYHGCLGRTPAPMKRRCLIVPLVTMPRNVYVTCGMDE